MKTNFTGKVAVVTGAGSGIGRAIALGLSRRGARLAISDIDPDGVGATRAMIAGDVEVDARELDVADGRAFDAYASAVADRFGVVHQVYNNAGIALGRSVLDSEIADYERVLGINLWGVIRGTKAFLPHLIESGDGHVINISSLNGYMASGELSHYCTAKFGVRGFTESLRAEMLLARHPVVVTVVHPGGVRTAIADRALAADRARGIEIGAVEEARRQAYNERLLRMSPDDAAAIILDGVEARRARVLVGRDAKLMDAVVRIAPSAHITAFVALRRRMRI